MNKKHSRYAVLPTRKLIRLHSFNLDNQSVLSSIHPVHFLIHHESLIPRHLSAILEAISKVLLDCEDSTESGDVAFSQCLSALLTLKKTSLAKGLISQAFIALPDLSKIINLATHSLRQDNLQQDIDSARKNVANMDIVVAGVREIVMIRDETSLSFYSITT
eukprot:scaffold659_cov192-Ochromonas_danica.AAC.12